MVDIYEIATSSFVGHTSDIVMCFSFLLFWIYSTVVHVLDKSIILLEHSRLLLERYVLSNAVGAFPEPKMLT